MNDAFRRRQDKLDREKVFFVDNAADFPAKSPVETLTLIIEAKMNEAIALDAQLITEIGDKAQALTNKEDRRDNLLDMFRLIVLGARAIGDAAEPGITAKFRIPRSRTDQNILAAADSFFAETAAPLEAKFLAVGLPADFRANLMTLRGEYQTARDETDSALEQHAEAVGALTALFREVMELARQRAALVKIKYIDNPGKQAAWKVASHLEKAPQAAPKP